MKKIIFPLLGLLMLGSSGCYNKTPGDRFDNYLGLVAIVDYDFFLNQPVLKTPIGTLVAPQLKGYFHDQIFTGDALFCNYITINRDNQPSEEYTIIWDLDCVIVNKEPLQATERGESESDDYTEPVEDLATYDMIGNVAFMWLYHTAPGFQLYNYEMTYDPDEKPMYDPDDGALITTVYVRAKENGKDNNSITTFYRWCAFDFNNFIMAKKDSETKLKIKIKLKIGKEDGKDVYKDWNDEEPIKLKIE